VSHHVLVQLPDGRMACADYRDPVVTYMRRINSWISEGRSPQARPDWAYRSVAQWLNLNEEQSARCRAYLSPGGPDCGHAGPTKGE